MEGEAKRKVPSVGDEFGAENRYWDLFHQKMTVKNKIRPDDGASFIAMVRTFQKRKQHVRTGDAERDEGNEEDVREIADVPHDIEGERGHALEYENGKTKPLGTVEPRNKYQCQLNTSKHTNGRNKKLHPLVKV